MAKRKVKKEDDHAFHMRMARETWILLKKESFVRCIPMGDIVTDLIEAKRASWIKRFNEIGELGSLE